MSKIQLRCRSKNPLKSLLTSVDADEKLMRKTETKDYGRTNTELPVPIQIIGRDRVQVYIHMNRRADAYTNIRVHQPGLRWYPFAMMSENKRYTLRARDVVPVKIFSPYYRIFSVIRGKLLDSEDVAALIDEAKVDLSNLQTSVTDIYTLRASPDPLDVVSQKFLDRPTRDWKQPKRTRWVVTQDSALDSDIVPLHTVRLLSGAEVYIKGNKGESVTLDSTQRRYTFPAPQREMEFYPVGTVLLELS